MLRDLGHNLEIFQIYESTFASNAAIGDELMDIFVNIINFWAQAIQFLRRNKRGMTSGAQGACHAYENRVSDWVLLGPSSGQL